MGTLPRVVLSVALAAGLSACATPSEEDCERFTEHMAELSTSEAKETQGEGSAAAVKAGDEDTLKRYHATCLEKVSMAEYTCAMRAKTFQELSDC